MNTLRKFIVCIVLLMCISAASAAVTPAEERGLDLSSLLGDGDLTENLGGLGSILELLGQASGRKLKDCKISSIPDQTYTGKAVRPVPTVTYDGKKLTRGTDFTLTYSNNTKVGTGKCTVKGKGRYSGTRTVSFKIVRKGSSGSSSSKSSTTAKKFNVKLSTTSYTYNGNAKKPAVTVTAGGKSVTKANYTVTYKNNKNVGTASVTVRGKGDYKGYTGEASFKIKLKKTSLGTVSSPSEGSVKATWKKDTQADGYQVQFCTNKSFSSGVKKISISGGGKQSCQQDSLTGGKKYYVRIRSYKKVGRVNWYSEWSAARQVKVK